MKMSGREKASVRLGAVCGVIGGAVAVALYFAYMQIFRPHPYNIIYLSNLPVAAVIGGMVGMVVAVLYTSNKS